MSLKLINIFLHYWRNNRQTVVIVLQDPAGIQKLHDYRIGSIVREYWLLLSLSSSPRGNAMGHHE